jgi:hypothetical protein
VVPMGSVILGGPSWKLPNMSYIVNDNVMNIKIHINKVLIIKSGHT